MIEEKAYEYGDIEVWAPVILDDVHEDKRQVALALIVAYRLKMWTSTHDHLLLASCDATRAVVHCVRTNP